MIGAEAAPIFLSLFATGLLGSVHCVGMCGPLLLAFDGALAQGNRPTARVGGFVAYHAGRLWTYAVLGGLAGGLVAAAGERIEMVSWQRPLAVTMALAVVVAGLILSGALPRLSLGAPAPACLRGANGTGWIGSLMRERTPAARLLLGVTLGLLPCGLVYAALLVAAGLGSPLAGAFGMLCFGTGTLPALSGVVLAGRLGPAWLRSGGRRWAATLLVAAGLFMLARAIWVPTPA